MLARSRRAVVAVILASAGLLADVACNKKPEISFTLTVPDGVRDTATWYEIGAFAGAACPTAAQLGAGIPATGATARAAFRKDDKNPPALGDLARGAYAFAAVAKTDDCRVIATGCTAVDVGDTDSVSIALKPKDPPSEPCAEGTVCKNAQCAPSNDNENPSVGAGCSLELLGSGPLGDPLGLAGTMVSHPAIVATDKGFLIAYREYDPIQAIARLTFAAIDTGGGLAKLTTENLPERCANGEESDAVGLSFSNGKGLAVVARALCNGKSGFDLFAVDGAGTITAPGQETGGTFASATLRLSPSHAVTPTPDGNAFYVAALRNAQAIAIPANDAKFTGGSVPYGGAAPHEVAAVASSDKLVAWLAAGSTTTVPPKDAGPDATPDPADGGKTSVLRLQMAAAGTAPSSLPAPIEIPGSWASLAAQGTRLVVATDGNAAGRSVQFHIFDLGSTTPTFEDGFTTDALGKIAYADVAFQKNRAFYAVGQPGAISVVAYHQLATNKPDFLNAAQLARSPRVPSLARVRDGRLAIAATDTRVAVVWATAQKLAEGDPTGGYAIMACR